MSQDRVVARILQQNPWWRGADNLNADPQLSQLQRSPFIWRPSLLNQVNLDAPSVYTVRGPRQVGKTTLLKLMIQQRLRGDFPPERLLYYSLDLERDPEQIVEIVQTAKSMSAARGPWCVFLDEVSAVPGWQQGVKFLRDQTEASRDCFVLTGSSSSDISGGAERLPGRRGPGGRLDKVMLPMSFSEFCQVTGVEDLPSEVVPIDEFLSASSLGTWLPRLNELDERLRVYSVTGGFPRAVRDYLENETVSRETMEILWAIVAGDAERAGKDRAAVLRVLERVVRSLGSPTSWLSMAQDAGFGSPRTAEEYAGLLADSFVLIILYALELGRGASPRRQKKLYPVDPLIARLPNSLDPGAPLPGVAGLIEGLVGVALFKEVESEPEESFRLPQRVFYWKSSSGREVDFVARPGRREIPLEVKYQSQVTGKDREALVKSFGRGIVLSRLTMDLDGPVKVIPASIFLALQSK